MLEGKKWKKNLTDKLFSNRYMNRFDYKVKGEAAAAAAAMPHELSLFHITNSSGVWPSKRRLRARSCSCSHREL